MPTHHHHHHHKQQQQQQQQPHQNQPINDASLSLSPSTRLVPDIHTTAHAGYIFAAFAAIAWYNSLELLVLCLSTFRHHRSKSTYFWSLLLASLSIIPQSLGYVLLFFLPEIPPWGPATLIVVGWCGMITGHSLVLWSRLHLVLHDPRILRYLLRLIVVDDILLQVPITVLLYGTVTFRSSRISDGYSVMERIQLVGFALQETLLSGIYVWEAARLLLLRPGGRHHRVLGQLLAINVLVLLLDVAVVGIQYAGFYSIQVMLKPVAYSVKLKLEYTILGRLVSVVEGAKAQDILSTQEFTMLPQHMIEE
ncbi:hypothetical protein BO70DRAFT_385817 [Aspergillus heteromorphus CBS 117.55]|uniref:DUF7703 domain-containing protein n=1 Tax=Aspergillus heteromorphus CBS 117.55 TaxID=1448321 RepID=A0A317WM13_9EURO|nr:uncharacterized protein BO70DRAFT_385817 [Aspergillus heteromorphus CBS 117.55]PWY87536.1 hypothetical protein BO70DRAFT_385817 [Aspergillus heteromorphus CBS 117.55]